MKKLYSFYLLIATLLVSFSSIASPGDTLKVYSHDETHWSWANNYLDTVQFPETGSYQKIIMHYVLGCPVGGCSEWDYKTNIEVWEPLTDSTYTKFEMARVITPYAGNKSYGWYHEYTFDVTDYAPLLSGEKIINAYYGGYQDGFTITVWFDFIEGTPARRVLSVNQVYRSGTGGYRYGFSSDPIEDYLTSKTFGVFPTTAEAKFRMVATGHGFGDDGGNPDNCAEFCDKYYSVKVDGTQRFQNVVWKNDCATDAIPDQTGSWLYNRAGWCPGSKAQVFDDYLSPYISGSQITIDVDWESYTYISGSSFDPHYWIEAQLFQYGETAYEIDAEIEKIVSPSTDGDYIRYNPTCGDAMILVNNNGETTIDSIKFNYSSHQGHVLEYTWIGTINSFESQEISLPVDHIYFYGSNNNTFSVEIAEVNGQIDNNTENNKASSTYETPDVYPTTFVCQLRTNSSPSENQLYIVNAITEDTIINHNNMSANTYYYDTLELETGCYTLYISDSGNDGLYSYFSPSQGSGSLKFSNIGLNTSDPYFIETFPSDFGGFYEYNFTVDYIMGDNPINDQKDDVSLYPNPANDIVNLEISTINNTDYTIQVISMDGKVIYNNKQNIDGVQTIQIPTGDVTPGIYIVKVYGNDSMHTKTLVVE